MIGRKGKRVQEPTTSQRRPDRPSPPPPAAEIPDTLPPDLPKQRTVRNTRGHRDFANIGKSITVKGELTGNEDLTVEGTVEGTIVLQDHRLTIGANAHVTAEVSAKSVAVVGHLVGNVSATDRIEVADGGTVEGDLSAPKVVLAEGARFRGTIDMLSGGSPTPAPQTNWTKPEPRPQPEPQTASNQVQNAPLPDDLIEDTHAEPKQQPSGKKNKTEKPGKKTSEASKKGSKLAEILDSFDPSTQ